MVALDYKTGAAPSGPQIGGGDAAQLPLEAAIARRGGAHGPVVRRVPSQRTRQSASLCGSHWTSPDSPVEAEVRVEVTAV